MQTKNPLDNCERDFVSVRSAAELMPIDSQSVRILAERAVNLARPEKVVLNDTSDMLYIKVHFGTSDYYGIPYQYASEIIYKSVITKVPFVPNYIAGVINWRGKLITIVNMMNLFGMKGESNCNYIIIITKKKMTIGVMVEKIDGSQSYDNESIDLALTANNSINPAYISGLHKGRVAIINMDSIFSELINILGGSKNE